MNRFTAGARWRDYTGDIMRPPAPSRSRRQLLRDSLALAGLGLLSGCGRLPFAAQPAPGPRTVGFLAPTTGPYIGTPTAIYEAFRRGLQDLGYVEGRDVLLDYRPVADPTQYAEQAAPGIARVAVLAYPKHPGEQREWRGTQLAAESLGLTLRRLEVSTAEDFDRAFAAMASEPTDALLAFSDGVTMAHRAPMAAFALEQRLPSAFGWREYVEAGGLLAYGPNLDEAWGRLATFVDRILRGAKPADLPVEEPSKFELTVNLRTARTIGLSVPSVVLEQATELIQ